MESQMLTDALDTAQKRVESYFDRHSGSGSLDSNLVCVYVSQCV